MTGISNTENGISIANAIAFHQKLSGWTDTTLGKWNHILISFLSKQPLQARRTGFVLSFQISWLCVVVQTVVTLCFKILINILIPHWKRTVWKFSKQRSSPSAWSLNSKLLFFTSLFASTKHSLQSLYYQSTREMFHRLCRTGKDIHDPNQSFFHHQSLVLAWNLSIKHICWMVFICGMEWMLHSCQVWMTYSTQVRYPSQLASLVSFSI